jgi:hypothetical protein
MSLRPRGWLFEVRRQVWNHVVTTPRPTTWTRLTYIAGLPVDETAEIQAEITTLRAVVDEAVVAEDAERMVRAAKMQLRRVESEVESTSPPTTS